MVEENSLSIKFKTENEVEVKKFECLIRKIKV